MSTIFERTRLDPFTNKFWGSDPTEAQDTQLNEHLTTGNHLLFLAVSGTNLRMVPLMQYRLSVGVLKPSPVNT